MARLQKQETYRPVMVLAYADSAHAAQCGRYFRRLGWEVHLVASAREARRLSALLRPRVTVLDTELSDENGWLTYADMTREEPARKVVMLAPEHRQAPIEDFAEAVLGRRLAEAV